MCKIKKSMFLEQYLLEQEVVQCFDHNDKVIEVKKRLYIYAAADSGVLYM